MILPVTFFDGSPYNSIQTAYMVNPARTGFLGFARLFGSAERKFERGDVWMPSMGVAAKSFKGDI